VEKLSQIEIKGANGKTINWLRINSSARLSASVLQVEELYDSHEMDVDPLALVTDDEKTQNEGECVMLV